MTISKHTRVLELLDSHPGARELFTWYGVGLDAQSRRMTLGELCRSEGLDIGDALAELEVGGDDEILDQGDDYVDDLDWFDDEE